MNDTAATNDVYSTSIGSNRHTGKLPSAPKPFPENLLRTYSLGANQTLFIDSGNYPLINPLIVSNDVGALGDDEGFTILGSTSVSARSILTPANPLVLFPVLELNDADLMTVRNLDLVSGTKGLWVREVSTDLQLEGIRALQNSQEGFLIDSGSNLLTATGLTASNNLSHGIAIYGSLGTLASSSITANAQTGLLLNNVGPALVHSNVISGNVGGATQGVQIVAPSGGSPLVFGDSNLALGRGNRLFNNSKIGISASGNVQIVGNTIYGHTGPNNFGISAGGGVTVSQNVVFGNTNGIQASGAVSVDGNRVYNQLDTGIVVTSTPVERNVIYNNQSGVRASSSTVRNNLVYANSQRGVQVDGTSQVLNNTIHQHAGEVLRASNAPGTQVLNNILWANGAGSFAMVVTSETTPTIVTDYNLFYLTAGGQAGVWGTGTAGDLARLQLTSGKNPNSLSADPLFVDADGADNVLGYSNTSNDGRDDDFHLQSPFGSFKGGAFAPVATGSGTGVPAALVGAYSNDVNQSPAIDAGRPGDSFVNEPAPNGNALNIGAFGNTSQASKSPTSYVNVLSPNGGEVWIANQTYPIRWNAHDLNTVGVTYTIELLQAGNPALVLATSAVGSGLFSWQVPANLAPANNYSIRVTRNDVSGLVDTSNSNLTIVGPTTTYYINDNSTSNDAYTTAIGNDSNDGLTPATPMASLQALLTLRDLGPGDTVFVDAGTYNLTSDIQILSNDSGVTIVGVPNTPTSKTIFNRGAVAGSNAFVLNNADNVTLRNFEVTGAGSVGIVISNDSDDVSILDSRLYGSNIQVSGDATSDRTRIAQSIFGGQTTRRQHFNLAGSSALVEFNNFSRGGGGGGGSTSMTLSGAASIFRNNEAVDDGVFSPARPFTTESDRIIVRDNLFRDSQASALSSFNGELIESNTFRNLRNPGAPNPPIAISSSAIVRNNTIYDTDIAFSGGGLFENNRVFNNNVGVITGTNARIIGNQIYDNVLGIRSFGNGDQILNNVLIRNDTGIQLTTGSLVTISSNTLVQPVGNAIEFNTGTNGQFLNNIFSVDSGIVFSAPTGATITGSDYNHFQLGGSALIANLNGQIVSDASAWYYAFGYDKNSASGDPQFVDLDGPDNKLGFDRGNGILASYFNTIDFSGSPVLQRVEPGVDFGLFGQSGSPAPGVNADNFTVRWEGFVHIATPGDYTFFVQNNDGVRLFFDNALRIDQWLSNGTEYSYVATGLAAGWYPIRYEMRELTGTASARLHWQGPGIAKQIIPRNVLGTFSGFTNTDMGADDNFVVQSTSPTIDAGSPLSAFINEPMPNGDRINIGSTGNTALATSKIGPAVYVLNPNGFEKVPVGSNLNVRWQASGLNLNRPVALHNLGSSSTVDNFLGDTISSGGQNVFISQNTDLSGVAEPAPLDVYKTGYQTIGSIGAQTTFTLPVPNGNYTLRLHFTSTSTANANMNILVNGATVATNYDIATAAGGVALRATQLNFTVSATDGTGVRVTIVANTVNGAAVHGLELLAANVGGIAAPRFDLQWTNDAANWNNIATNAPVDRFGRGQFNWSVPTNLPLSANYRVRVISSATTPWPSINPTRHLKL